VLIVHDRLQVPLRELHLTFARSSGPGGQNVNKVATKATLRFAITRSEAVPKDVASRVAALYPRRMTNDGEVVITSQRFRDQGRNVADCIEKLRTMLAEAAVPPTPRRRPKPPRASKERRLRGKRHIAVKKQRRRIDDAS
jgi:ribosome-associated protein